MAAVKQEEGAASGRAKIMISGYESEMYNGYLQGWRKESFSPSADTLYSGPAGYPWKPSDSHTDVSMR